MDQELKQHLEQMETRILSDLRQAVLDAETRLLTAFHGYAVATVTTP